MEKINNAELTLEICKSFLSEHTNLFYVDYRESFDENLESLQKSIQNNSFEYLDELLNDMSDWEAVQNYLDSLKEKLLNEGYSQKQINDFFIFENEEYLIDEIRNRDTSTPLNDLLKNTSQKACFYDLCVSVDDYTTPIKERLREVKKALKLKAKDKTYDDRLIELCENAGYGGDLVIYFLPKWKELIQIEANQITFDKIHIAIINNGNGSGHDVYLGTSLTIPYKPTNVYIDKCVKYCYVSDVCGMSDDFCESTTYTLKLNKRLKKKEEAEKTKKQKFLEREAELDKVYRSGSCTPGDMKYNRHQGPQVYINDYPCGNRCEHCGTFWID